MRFPSSLTLAMGGYLLRQTILRRKRFAMVLMLEPLHACNLRCTGCGRIREYAETLSQRMPVADCLAAADECAAPIVSLCGGEPLLYPHLTELIEGLLARGKHLYLCTNGLELEKRLPQILAIRSRRLHSRRLRSRLYFNVHLDGPAELHDAMANHPGAYRQALAGITAAKRAGFRVYTNTTVYRPTTIAALTTMAEELSTLGVDGLMISPGFGYEAVEGGDQIFMTRQEIGDFFQQVRRELAPFRLTATPVFFDFLCGERQLPCAAWANPTRNIGGWRSPCYLIADRHTASWRELLDKTDWGAYGPGRDARCTDCMTHCGFEPASVLAAQTPSEILRLIRWQMGSPTVD